MNALTFDVEEWFQVNCLRNVASDREDELESRVVEQTRKVLSILDEYDAKATFFLLGKVCEEHPELAIQIIEGGHEVASHGFGHQKVYEMTENEFTLDIDASIKSIESACGVKPIGYRAPNFSVTNDCNWIFDVLKEKGFSYDSSIYPSRIVNLNAPSKPTSLTKMSNGLWEVPGSTKSILGFRVPYGGGVFLRNKPYYLTKRLIKKENKKNQMTVTYMHPWELDPHHPKIPCSLKARVIHYSGLNHGEKILRNLLKDFEFKPIKEIINEQREEY
ncbi:MAG: polysaccharide deacetylase family protein [Methanobacteriota archaeon]